mgnify:CR=1 FL=1
MDAKYEQRKKMIYDFMCDDMYVPMKIKELAIVLGVKKDQRPQLEQILNDYHITYDRSRFVVEYTPNGSNLLPYISVILLSDTAGHGKGAAK